MGGGSKAKQTNSINDNNRQMQRLMMNYPAKTLEETLGSLDGLMGNLTGGFGGIIDGLLGAGSAISGIDFDVEKNGLTQFLDKQGLLNEPEAVAEPEATPSNGWDMVKTNQDAINWSLAKGDITDEEADWLNRWLADSSMKGDAFTAGGGGFKDWDINGSTLDSRNKGIANKFRTSISGNWGGSTGGSTGGGQQQSAATTTYQMPNGGIFDINEYMRQQNLGGY